LIITIVKPADSAPSFLTKAIKETVLIAKERISALSFGVPKEQVLGIFTLGYIGAVPLDVDHVVCVRSLSRLTAMTG
jgi:hypothetical protein